MISNAMLQLLIANSFRDVLIYVYLDRVNGLEFQKALVFQQYMQVYTAKTRAKNKKLRSFLNFSH